jgi:hypothetical protein
MDDARNQPEFPQPKEIPPSKLSDAIDLLEWIYIHRFVTSRQLVGAYPGLWAERTARRYLLELRQAQLVNVVVVRRSHFSKEYFQYFVTSRGLTLVKDKRDKVGFSFEGRREDSRLRGRTEETSKHEEGLTDVQIRLEQIVTGAGGKFLLNERRFRQTNRKLTFLSQGEKKDFFPDWGFLGIQKNERLFPVHFLEFDRCSKSVKELHNQLENYYRWSKRAEGYLEPLYRHYGVPNAKPIFRILFVIDRGEESLEAESVRVDRLLEKAEELPESFRKMVWIIGKTRLDSAYPVWFRPGLPDAYLL